MLPIPTTTTGLGYEEVDETTIYADWVECSALFHDEEISKSDVKDCFSEIDSFDSEKTPLIVADIWSELERRKLLLGQRCPVSIKGNRITAMNWQNYAAYSFCLLLSYSKSNREWERKFCNDYQTQGEFFEHISVASLRHLLKDWEVNLTGWSKANSTNIKRQIKDIASELGESIGQETPRPVDKDGGVDVLCYRLFPDKRGNYPVIFVQCATGRNWTDKRREDALRLWSNWIHFKTPNLLSRGFAVPFAFGDETFRQTQIHGDCLILDRIRLFSHNTIESKWLSINLLTKIEAWVTQKLKTLSED
jgi:hypothetical protein